MYRIINNTFHSRCDFKIYQIVLNDQKFIGLYINIKKVVQYLLNFLLAKTLHFSWVFVK